MPKLNFLTPSLALIIVAMGFFIAWQCESGKRKDAEAEQGDRLHQEQVQKLETDKAISVAEVKRLEQDRKNYTDSSKVAQNAAKKEIQASKVTIAKLRSNLQPKIDSFPELSDLISKQDAVILAQDSLIAAIESAHGVEIVNLESQLRESARQNVKQVEISESWRLAAEDAQRDVRKANRKKGFWRTTTAILAGAVVILTLQQ